MKKGIFLGVLFCLLFMNQALASDKKIWTKSKDASVKCYERDSGYYSDIECKIFATNENNSQPLKFEYNKKLLTAKGSHEDNFEMILIPQDLESKYKFLFDKPAELKIYVGYKFEKDKIKIDEKINLYSLSSQDIYSTPVKDLEFALAVEVDDLDIKTDEIKNKIKKRIKGAGERKRLNPLAKKLYYDEKNHKYYYLFRFKLSLKKSHLENRTIPKLYYAPPRTQRQKEKYYYRVEVVGMPRNEHRIKRISGQRIGERIEIDRQSYKLMVKNKHKLQKSLRNNPNYKVQMTHSFNDVIGNTLEFKLTPISRLPEIQPEKQEHVMLKNKLSFEFDLPGSDKVNSITNVGNKDNNWIFRVGNTNKNWLKSCDSEEKTCTLADNISDEDIERYIKQTQLPKYYLTSYNKIKKIVKVTTRKLLINAGDRPCKSFIHGIPIDSLSTKSVFIEGPKSNEKGSLLPITKAVYNKLYYGDLNKNLNKTFYNYAQKIKEVKFMDNIIIQLENIKAVKYLSIKLDTSFNDDYMEDFRKLQIRYSSDGDFAYFDETQRSFKFRIPICESANINKLSVKMAGKNESKKDHDSNSFSIYNHMFSVKGKNIISSPEYQIHLIKLQFYERDLNSKIKKSPLYSNFRIKEIGSISSKGKESFKFKRKIPLNHVNNVQSYLRDKFNTDKISVNDSQYKLSLLDLKEDDPKVATTTINYLIKNLKERVLFVYYPLSLNQSYRTYFNRFNDLQGAISRLNSDFANILYDMKKYDKIFIRFADELIVEYKGVESLPGYFNITNKKALTNARFSWQESKISADFENYFKNVTPKIDVLYLSHFDSLSAVRNIFYNFSESKIYLVNFSINPIEGMWNSLKNKDPIMYSFMNKIKTKHIHLRSEEPLDKVRGVLDLNDISLFFENS